MKKRVLLLSLMSILLLLCVPLIGCDSEEGLAAEDIADIVEAVGTNEQEACTFDMTISASVDVSAEGQSMEASVNGGGEGSIDFGDQSVHMPITINATIPYLGTETLDMEMYIVGGWMYMNMDGDWTKMELPEDILVEQDQSMMIGQLTDLMSLVDIQDKGTEKVNDVQCYKLVIEPDLAELAEYAMEQFPQSEIGGSELDVLGEVEGIMSAFDVECTFWISEDEVNPLLMKIALDIDGNLSSNDIPEMAESGFNSMSLDMSMEIVFEYPKSVDISLPTEAQYAYEQGTSEW